MDVSMFIAGRIRFKGRIAVISIAVSFLVMIIAVSVSSGFRNEIRGGISELSGDIVLTTPGVNIMEKSSPISNDASYLSYVCELQGVDHVRSAVYCAGMLKQGEELYGAMFKGTDDPSSLPDTVSLAVSVPTSLAEKAGIEIGDRLLAYFISDKVKIRQFNVASVYEPMVEVGSNPVIKARLSDLQRLEGWSADKVSCLEIVLDPSHRDAESIKELTQDVGALVRLYDEDDDSSVIAVSSLSRYPTLFDWLDLIEFNVFIILLLMTIVAGFNMISGLLILLFENISTIGLLKSLGMTDKAISKVFLASSASLVLKGMFWGNAAALTFCIVQGTTHLLRLDPENYFVPYVPVDVNFPAVLLADAAAFAVIMLLLLIPCLFISKVDPAETVRIK